MLFFIYYTNHQFFTSTNKLLPLFTNIRPILTNQIHALHSLRFQCCWHHVELTVQKYVAIVVIVYWCNFLNLDIFIFCQNNWQNWKVEDIDNWSILLPGQFCSKNELLTSIYQNQNQINTFFLCKKDWSFQKSSQKTHLQACLSRNCFVLLG